MPLLKIGNQFVNTDLIVSWGEKTVGKTHYLYGMSSDSQDWVISFSDPDEIDAMLRWLNANSTDIMVNAPQPAPVMTPRKWNIGDKIKAQFTGTVIDVKLAESDAHTDDVQIRWNEFNHPLWVCPHEIEPAD